jgi:PEP-CTERM motif
MKYRINTILSAGLLALGLVATAQAGVVTTHVVDSVVNAVLPSVANTPLATGALSTGVQVNIGDTVTISTGANDTWSLNGAQVTAVGYPAPNFGNGGHNHYNAPGLNEITPIDYGALAFSLNGMDWAGAYNDVSLATTWTFTATSAGTLLLAMWDSVTSDNTAANMDGRILTVSVDLTPGAGTGNDVPEPSTLALLTLALGGLAASRKRKTAR